MTRSIEKSAKTVEDAIDLAISELNTTREDVDVDILDEGNKGLLGIIGGKNAKVRVSLKNGISANKFLKKIFELMDVDVDIQTTVSNKDLNVDITGKDVGIAIGYRGETLDALQYITNIVENKNKEEYTRINLDIEGYRKKREEALIRLAEKTADRAIKSKRSITLEPMSSYERRVIHSVLQNKSGIDTVSIGNEPDRRIRISLKS